MKLGWIIAIILLNVVLLDYHYSIRIPVLTVVPLTFIVGVMMIMWFNDLTVRQLLVQLIWGRSIPQPINSDTMPSQSTTHSVDLPPEMVNNIPPTLVPIISGGLGVVREALHLFGNPDSFRPPKSITDKNHQEDVKLLNSIIEEVD